MNDEFREPDRIGLSVEQMAELLFSGDLLLEKELDDLCLRLGDERYAGVRNTVLERYFSSVRLPSGSAVPADVECRWAELAVRLGLNSDLNHYRSMSSQRAQVNGTFRASDASRSIRPVSAPFRRTRFFPVYLRVAAVLVPALVATGIWFLMNRSPYGEFRIASADHVQQVLLPDSTYVSVEAGSRAVYRETEHSRDVELSGDAFFKVRRDETKPFHVSAGAMELTVLGTEFDVSQRAGTVSLFSGNVSVGTGDAADTLSWGDRFTFDSATGLSKISVIPSSEMIAKGYKPRLKFDRATLGEIFTALDAYHEVEITAPELDLQNGKLTVDFDGSTLESALDLFVKINKSRLTYSIEGNRVVIAKQ